MKNILRIIVVGGAALLPHLAHAGLNVPYPVDPDAMHLWHFDSGTAAGIFTTVTDSVPANAITLTNFGQPANMPPYTNLFLLNSSAVPSLGGSLQILPGDGATNAAGAYLAARSHGMAAGPVDMAPTNFFNSISGAFTFEALVYIGGNIFNASAGSGEWEIFSGDNSVGTRGWQFRLVNGAAPGMNLNFLMIGGGGSAANFNFPLPTTGPDALAVGSWYHVAATYTGNAPTNTDNPGVVTFYWTAFDPNRTNVDVLTTFTESIPGTLGGTPSPAVGGSQRTSSGVGNGGSFQGQIDEVRVSDIARAPTDMIYNSSIVPTAPSITAAHEPPTNILTGFGQNLSLNPVFAGSQLAFQWQEKNSQGVFTNVAGQTANTLSISNITFASAGSYWLIASNSIATATTTVTTITVGANPSELFSTGVNSSGVVDTALAAVPDPHYFITQSADLTALGPPAIVWNMNNNPIAAAGGGGTFANIDGISQWIGTHNDTATSPAGAYVFRTSFLMDVTDPAQPMTINGTTWFNTGLSDILVNGVSAGIHPAQSGNPQSAVGFVITNGYVPGLNTLDFLVTNSNGTETALRLELSAVGHALPPGKPNILRNPAPVTVSDANLTGIAANVTFSVVATGRPPLTYQWLDQNSAPIAGATNRTLSYVAPFAGQQPTCFSCVVSNTSGAVTSTPASLTLVSTNIPPVVQNYSFVIYTNQVLNINFDSIFNAASDQNGIPLIYATSDSLGTNSQSTIVANGATLTYTPGPGLAGMDSFTYTLEALDAALTPATGTIFINVVPGPLPANFAGVSLSANRLVLKASGGTPGGPFNVLTTTSITNALTNWTVLSSTNFDASGNFSITNAVTPGTPAQFFIIQFP